MSFWTHVNGSVRVDNFVDRALFKTCSFDGTVEEQDACNVPEGSECSLDVQVWNSIERYRLMSTINFFGDLRNYYNYQDIVDWITGVINDHKWFVRDGVITCNESVYIYMADVKKFTEIAFN